MLERVCCMCLRLRFMTIEMREIFICLLKKKKKLFTDCTSLIVCVWGLDRDRKKLSGYKKMWGGKRCAGLWTVSAGPLEWNDTSCEERPLVSVILCLSCRSLWLSVSFGVCQNGIKLLSQWLVSSTLTDLSGNGRYGFEHFNVVFFFFFFALGCGHNLHQCTTLKAV